MKTICFFGIYDPGYSRNRVLINGFRENRWKVIECRVDPRAEKGLSKYASLYREYKKIKHEQIDHVLVAFPGQTMVLFATLLFKRRVIFDMFLSLYDSNVFDRKIYGRYSPKAAKDWLLDWHSCLASGAILLDTHEHISYVAHAFLVSRSKMKRVPIGSDMSIFKPIMRAAGAKEGAKGEKRPFIAHFHGMFIPLQGIGYIIEAARLLRDEGVVFQIVGSGQEFKKIEAVVAERGLTNVALVGKKQLRELPDLIAQSDVCLGIFGDTEKAKRVIPNKVYECIQMKRPVITADTLAIRESFADGVDIILCKIADAQAIADAIRAVRADRAMGERIAAVAYAKSQAEFTSHAIVERLIKDLDI